MSDPVAIYVITESPRDYPGKFVVREQRIQNGAISFVCPPKAVVDSLDEARAAVPPGMYWINRQHGDDPVIVEMWV